MARLWCFSDDDGVSLLCQSDSRWHRGKGSVAVLEATPLAAICAHLIMSDARHPRALPPGHRLMEVTVSDSDIDDAAVVKNWAGDQIATQAAGNSWLARGVAPVLRVPALSGASQYLFNTRHRNASRCRVRILDANAIATCVGDLSHAVVNGTDWLAAAPAPAVAVQAAPVVAVTGAAAPVAAAAGAD
jgi:hypothetical protein